MSSGKKKSILVLGAGFGGLATANELRSQLSESQASITVIDKKDYFMMDLVKLWILYGTREFEKSKTPLQNMSKKGIDFVNDEIQKINVDDKSVTTKNNKFQYDYLVISLGVELVPNKVPGLVEHSYVLYDAEHAAKINQSIKSMQSGKIAFLVTSMPYKCPPAPYEAALLVRSMLSEQGKGDEQIQISFYYPAEITLPAGGPQVSSQILDILESNKIKFYGSQKVKEINSNSIKFQDDTTANFDLLITVPPHNVPKVMVDSGLASNDSAFVKVNRDCKLPSHQDIYVIGDVNSMPVSETMAVPKAGIFAEKEGVTVARNIAYSIRQEQKQDTFDGHGGCYLEMGRKNAGYIEVDMFSPQGPSTKLGQPSPEFYQEKEKFEKERLQKWLE